MRRRRLVALLAVALVVVPGIATAAVVGSPDLSASVVDNRLVPGEQTTVDVVLVNSGDLESASRVNPQLDSQVTTARGLHVGLDNGSAPFTVHTNRQAVGTLPEGASQPISFGVTVDEDAEPGTYRVPVRVSYKHTSYISEGDGTRESESVDETLYLRVHVRESARLSVDSVDSDAQIGAGGTVSVTVENTGSTTARDATLSLTSESSDVTFGQSATATRYLGDWEAGEQRTLEYQVTASESAREQPYPFTLSASYEDDDGRQMNTSPISLGITPREEQGFEVVETDGDVPVGDEGTYEVTLVNDGPDNVTDATVQIASQNSDVTFGEAGSATRYVGNWAAGEERTVSVTPAVSSSADRESYALSTTVSYDDGEGDSGESGPIPVGLVPEPEQSFGIDGVNSTLRVGEEGRLSGELTNEGQATVENVVLRWSSEQRNVDPGESEYAVGSLEPGESAEFAFDVDVSDAAESGPRQFTFDTRYRNAEGDQRTGDPIDVRTEVAPARDKFDVTLETTTVTAGQSSEVNVTLTNAADERLTDISAALFADSPISADDDEAFVEGLDPGESRTIKFSISAGAGALEKTYPLSMDFQYVEPDGDTLTSDTYRVPISVEHTDGGGSSLTIIGAGLLLVLLGLGAVFRYR